MNDHHTVEYTLTEKEYKEARKVFRTQSEKISRVAVLILFFVMFFLFFVEDQTGKIRVGILILIMFSFLIFIWLNNIGHMSNVLQPSTATITSRVINIKNKNSEFSLEWKYIEKITENKDFIHFLVPKKKPRKDIIIPKRAFSDSSEAEKFVNYATYFSEK
ncbi:YcxB family protein [Virgibacillus litoralis]|uniref:YcxB-like C-terminal domain-containing protein n=1 Tax=Virgibacillus litoralis TaxID=578221 RepID=A0ABS4HEL4_9BACI|nr:YcxB family protein [Virgibacillus litoralis]MBP1949362.1 hypothetical protein [Virgibacillus litoralis]